MTSLRVQSLRKQPLDKLFQSVSADALLAKQLRPVIGLLSAFSPYGISWRTSIDNCPDAPRKIIYEAPKLSWRRPISVYSLVLLLWMVLCVCIQIFNTSLNIPFPMDLVSLRSQSNTSGEITFLLSTNRFAAIFTSSCRIFEFIGLFLSAPILAQWLNELTAMQTEFNTNLRHTSARAIVNITHLRNILIAFYLTLLGALWMAGTYWAFLPQYHFNPKYYAFRHIWFLSLTFFLMVAELLEDVKMVLMLEILKRLYSQVRSAVVQEISHKEIKEKNVVAWDAIVTKLRRHVKLTGDCLKTQLMLNVCETIFALSVGTYLVIRSAGGSSNSSANIGFVLNSGFYCVNLAGRLYTKVAIAESIYAEERQLVEDLKDSEHRIRADSPEALHELRNLQQSLVLIPAKVSIGNYCDLDSKLLVQVIVQTIPMLIAVAQLHTWR